MTLPATGILTYGSAATGTATFDGIVRTKVAVKPTLDEAGRILVYNAITFEVTARVSANPTDGVVNSLRYILTSPGLALHYDGKGFGALFSVNETSSAAGFVDCVWGPIPEIVQYDPIGNNEGANIVWRCTVHVKECSPGAGPNANNQLLAFNYDQAWAISDEGLTTRTTTGYLEIGSQEGRLNRTVSYYADTFREKANLPLLKGFRRTSQVKMDKSKRRLDFTYTDAELPYALPSGCTRCECTHTLESSLEKGFMVWQGTISAKITTGPAPIKKSDSVDRFQLIVNSRIGDAKAALGFVVQQPAVGGAQPTVMLTGYSVSEEIFERITSFQVRYTIIGCTLNQLIQGGVSQLWTATQGIDFNTWQLSMSQNIQTARGSAGLRTVAGDDVLLDLCNPTPQTPKGQQSAALGAALSKPKFRAQVGDQIDPKVSWVYFRCRLALDEDDRVAVHKPLTGAAGATAAAAPYPLLSASGNAGSSSGGGSATGASPTGGPAPGVKATVPDLVQRVSAPSYRIRVVGEAMRLEYRVPVPAAVTIGGQQATQTYRHVEEEQIASVGGIPIFYTAWDVGYVLPGTPTDLGAPANPQFLTPGWTGAAANIGNNT